MLGGNLETRTLSGWGFDYLVMDKISQPASTMMACPEDSKPQVKFVTANLGDAAMQRYNSRLPIVVYVPQGGSQIPDLGSGRRYQKCAGQIALINQALFRAWAKY